jgi:hypothetical protein
MTVRERRVVRLAMLGIVAAFACHGPAGPPRTTTAIARWSGTFKANRMNSELGRSVPNSGFGSIALTPVENAARPTIVEISINVPVAAGEQVPWAVLSGNCGSAHPMLAGPSEFPTMEVSGNGSASLRADMPFALDAHGTYHANIYWPNRTRDLNDVMMCANLTLGA